MYGMRCGMSHKHCCNGAFWECMHAQGNSHAARQFHDVLGQLAMATLPGWRALAGAADHFSRGTDMGTFARLLHDQAEAEGGHELFITRAVLQVRHSLVLASLLL